MTVVVKNIHDAINYMLAEQRTGIYRGVKKEKKACYADHDGATGDRNPFWDDDTHLWDFQHKNVMDSARNHALWGVVTSRDLPIMHKIYFTDHAKSSSEIPGSFSVLGSGGYRFVTDISDCSNPLMVPVRDKNGKAYSDHVVAEAVAGEWSITDILQQKYGNTASDRRAISSTSLIRASFCGKDALDEYIAEGDALTEDLRKQLDGSIEIKCDSSYNDRFTGYRDWKLTEATKYKGLSWLFENNKYGTKISDLNVVMSWGDTAPDEDMMNAVIDHTDRERVICVGVGPKIEGKKLKNGLDVSILPEKECGFTPVDLMHAIIKTEHSAGLMAKLVGQEVITREQLYGVKRIPPYQPPQVA